jgi:hypothetical protein
MLYIILWIWLISCSDGVAAQPLGPGEVPRRDPDPLQDPRDGTPDPWYFLGNDKIPMLSGIVSRSVE